MKGLLRLAIVALIGYGLYTYFVQKEIEGPADDHGEYDSPARCIDRLDDAIDALGSAVRTFGVPPVDTDAWAATYDDLRQYRSLAAGACQCAEYACRRGLEAAGLYGDLISELDEGITSGSGPPSNAAAQMDRILRLYEEAKALL